MWKLCKRDFAVGDKVFLNAKKDTRAWVHNTVADFKRFHDPRLTAIETLDDVLSKGQVPQVEVVEQCTGDAFCDEREGGKKLYYVRFFYGLPVCFVVSNEELISEL